MNSKEYSLIHNLPLECQYEALEIYINSKLIDQRSVTHNDIIAIGNKLRQLVNESNDENYLDHDASDYLDNEINKSRMKLEKQHSMEIDKLKTELNEEKTQQLDEMKAKYENLIDRITDLHKQSEQTKLNTQKRKFEIELKQKLEEQAENLEQHHKEIMKKEREEYYEKFCQQFEHKIKEAVKLSKLEQQKLFDKEKKQLIEELEENNKNHEEILLNELDKKFHEAEKSMKIRYRQLYSEYENICEFHNNLEQDYQELQSEFQRFIDSTEGYFQSDYLLKLRSHAIKNCEEKMKLFKSTLTEYLFSPNDFDRSLYK